MEVCTETISAYTTKSLVARQLQWTSVPALWWFWGFWYQQEFLLNCLQNQNCKWMILMLYWVHHQNLHSAGTLIQCACVTSSGLAGNDELVAVDSFIDVGNILWIFYDCLCPQFLKSYSLPPYINVFMIWVWHCRVHDAWHLKNTTGVEIIPLSHPGPILPVEPQRQRPQVMVMRRPSDLGVHTRRRRSHLNKMFMTDII